MAYINVEAQLSVRDMYEGMDDLEREDMYELLVEGGYVDDIEMRGYHPDELEYQIALKTLTGYYHRLSLVEINFIKKLADR